MSDPTPPIPPARPPTLSYQTPGKRDLPIGVQVTLGCILTVTVLGGLCFGSGYLSITVDRRAMGLTILSASAAIVFTVSFHYARLMRMDERRRGWAIGVYIGMGLAGLLWGFCALVVDLASHPS